jgi:DNA-binding PadR family transcriptional regulator
MPRALSFAAVAVLRAVATGRAYGFDVIDATGLPSGTVYPALGRLERAGYVRSSWERPATAHEQKRPPRRYYRVTAGGVRALNAEVERFRALTPVPALAQGRRS